MSTNPLLKLGFYGNKREDSSNSSTVTGVMKITNESEIDTHNINGDVEFWGEGRKIAALSLCVPTLLANTTFEQITSIIASECIDHDKVLHNLRATTKDNRELSVNLRVVRFKLPLEASKSTRSSLFDGTSIGASVRLIGIQFAFMWYLFFVGALTGIGGANFLPLRFIGWGIVYAALPTLILSIIFNFPRGINSQNWSSERAKFIKTALGPLAAIAIGGSISFVAITAGLVQDSRSAVRSFLKIFGYCFIGIGVLGSIQSLQWFFSTTRESTTMNNEKGATHENH